jgi:hypothetical protein
VEQINVVLFLDACRDQGDRMGLGIGDKGIKESSPSIPALLISSLGKLMNYNMAHLPIHCYKDCDYRGG